MLVTTANITDREGAIAMLTRYATNSDTLDRLIKLLVDGGYTGEEFADVVKTLCGAGRLKRKTAGTLPFGWKPKEHGARKI